MKRLPVPDPGEPDIRSPGRYLLWIARRQSGTMIAGILLGIGWMVAQAFIPATVGWAIDAVTRRDLPALWRAVAVMVALGIASGYCGVMRHRFAVTNWLGGAYRTVQVTVRQSTRLGATLTKKVTTGEVVAIGTADLSQIGHAMDITARGCGAVCAIVVVGVVLLSVSVPLGLVVVCGVPILVTVVAVLLRPLHRRQHAQRELSGKLTGRAGDIVAGLRVLRGVGGEAAFSARYRVESQQVRAAGVGVAKVEALLEAAQVLLPGIFVVIVTWLGARFALADRITPGQLVAFYAYAAFLVMPLRTLTETADKLTRGHVAARRVINLLRLTPEVADPVDPATPPPVVDGRIDGNLVDPDSGVVIRPGRLTAIAAARSEDAVTIADRLGRLDASSDARLRGVPLKNLSLAAVRERIVVADNDARLFRGRLRDELGVAGDDDAALHAAAAEDIVAALPDGLDTEIAERGREFSGGQQQRLRLVRALAAEPPILVLVEPTSAVDAHTEARIAARLAAARSGRTTVVCTTSPLLLDRADTVIYVADCRAVAEGTHRELLDTCPAYLTTVTRGEDTE